MSAVVIMVKKNYGQMPPLISGKYFSIFAIIGFLLFLSGCSTKPIVTVKSEAEAIEIVDVLREYDISATKNDVVENNVRQFQILVHGDGFGDDANAAAFEILNAHCLPQKEPAPVESSTLSSPVTERAKIQRQQKMNVVAQLRSLPGATCVDFNFSLSQDPLEAVKPYPARAAVTLHHKTQDIPYKEAEIKELVSGTVPNMLAENVTVKFIYQPIAKPEKSKSGALTRILLVGGAALVIILGSVFLVYYLRKSRQSKAIALAEQPEGVETAETVQ